MLCTERSLVKTDGGHLTVSPLRCKCWHCDYCAPQRRRELRRDALKGKPTIFLTLTIRQGRYATPDLQAQALRDGWRMLRQYLCRTLGWKKLPFLAVVEKHKSGWPHLHILIRSTFISHKLIRDWWTAREDSPVIWINRLHNPRKAAKYVTKYMSKDPTAFDGCKRYWRSQDYKLPDPANDNEPPEDGAYWQALSVTPNGLARAALADGARCTWHGSRIYITHWSLPDRRRIGLE